MIKTSSFQYTPGEHEKEKASNSYLMSLVAFMAGMPLPIVNLLASVFFFFGNRKGTYFVRWHCTQALVSQLSIFFLNSYGFWWVVSIVFWNGQATNSFFAYLILIFLVNLTEFIATIYTAIQTRKGIHVEWWFYGNLTHLFCKK